MSGRWAAPGRVNVIGEHVDYADGLCLPFAIAERTVVEVTARDDEQVRLASDSEPGGFDGELTEIGPGSPKGWAGYAAGVLWALREAGHAVGGIDLRVTDTVPLGAGLSSSAALECATAIAVDELFGLGLPRTELAEACIRAENDVVGAATGGMDQAASLLGTAGHALLIDTRNGDTRQVPFSPSDAGLAVVVIDTKVRHALADGQYGERRAAVEAAVARIGSLRDASLDEVAGLPARHPAARTARRHRDRAGPPGRRAAGPGPDRRAGTAAGRLARLAGPRPRGVVRGAGPRRRDRPRRRRTGRADGGWRLRRLGDRADPPGPRRRRDRGRAGRVRCGRPRRAGGPHGRAVGRCVPAELTPLGHDHDAARRCSLRYRRALLRAASFSMATGGCRPS